MKAGIAVDDWKLPVFRKRLTEAGYTYEDGGSLVGATTLLQVEIADDDVPALQKLLVECQNECSRNKRK